jgi:hypothetical protein
MQHVPFTDGPGFGRSRRLAMVAIFLAGIIVALCPLSVYAQSPTITSISTITTEKFQTIVIKGSGFGTHKAYTGDSGDISLLDTSKSWQAGYEGYHFDDRYVHDTVFLIVHSWEDTQITLGGFSGQWGKSGWTLNKGNTEQVSIWNASTGEGPAVENVAIAGEPTATKLSSSPNPSTHGEEVTFTAVVDSKSGAPPSAGTVQFKQGKKVLGTEKLSSGSAKFTTSTLAVGTHTITAVFEANVDFDASTSTVVKQVVKE